MPARIEITGSQTPLQILSDVEDSNKYESPYTQ
jgi:hypothetical protein